MAEPNPLVQACRILSRSFERLRIAVQGQHAARVEALGDGACMSRQPAGAVHVSSVRPDRQVGESFGDQNGNMFHFSIDIESQLRRPLQVGRIRSHISLELRVKLLLEVQRDNVFEKAELHLFVLQLQRFP